MTDRYRISEAPETHHDAQHAGPRAGLLRPMLWLALILSAAANAVSSSIGANTLAGVGFGVITLACATALTVPHDRHRRR